MQWVELASEWDPPSVPRPCPAMATGLQDSSLGIGAGCYGNSIKTQNKKFHFSPPLVRNGGGAWNCGHRAPRGAAGMPLHNQPPLREAGPGPGLSLHKPCHQPPFLPGRARKGSIVKPCMVVSINREAPPLPLLQPSYLQPECARAKLRTGRPLQNPCP